MRSERDSMGEMSVPDGAMYGATTQRAVLNFPVSGRALPPEFISSLGLVKWACARANLQLGLISEEKSAAVQLAAREIYEGKWLQHFPVDIFQTGSGTSTNMNANEVIAHRAGKLPSGAALHPNDDVNLSQSSNDIIPTALHVSVALALARKLRPALDALAEALGKKSTEFAAMVKIGRTHLMDATPVTLGQEFSGYAAQVRKASERVARGVSVLEELAVGGTAVGTGINCPPEFSGLVCECLAQESGIAFREAANHFEAQAGRDDCAEVAGILSAVAGALGKIASDLRLLSSGPRAGLAELRLPATQPGSSIMPGKVNPVMCEMIIQVALYTQGLMQTVMAAARDGQLELNVTLPLMAYNLHEAIRCLGNSINIFADKCIKGLMADEARCRELMDRSLMLVTALSPFLGYDVAAAVAKEAFASGRTLREIVLERKLLDAATLDRALDPARMTQPGRGALGAGGG